MSVLVRLQFSTGRSLASRLIRYVSHSAISHVDLMLADGCLLGAQGSRYAVSYASAARWPVLDRDPDGRIPAGVQVRPPDYERFSMRIVAEIVTSEAKALAIEDFFRSQIGKPYDFRGVFGFVVGFERDRDWRDPTSWFCDELAMRAFESAGFFPRPLSLPADHMTPGDALLVLSPWASLRTY